MFIETPRLVFEYSVDIIGVIKYTVFILVWIVNLFVDLHNYLNVRAMASKFRKHGVRNWAASKNSPDHCSLDRMNPTISFFERENLVHWFTNSTMEKKIANEEKKIRKCFLTNPKKQRTISSIGKLVSSWEQTLLPKKGPKHFCCLREERKPHFLSDRETKKSQTSSISRKIIKLELKIQLLKIVTSSDYLQLLKIQL